MKPIYKSHKRKAETILQRSEKEAEPTGVKEVTERGKEVDPKHVKEAKEVDPKKEEKEASEAIESKPKGDPTSRYLKYRRPDLFAQIHPTRNSGINLDLLTFASAKMIWWICLDHKTCEEHVWQATPESRTKSRDTRCPFCRTASFSVCQMRYRKMYCKCNDTARETIWTDKERSSIPTAMRRLFLHGKKCVDCGESDPYVLECDHIDDNKQTNKHGRKIVVADCSLFTMGSELMKTAPRCSCCHFLKTQLSWSTRRGDHKDGYARTNRNRQLVVDAKIKIGKCFDCNREVITGKDLAFSFEHIDPRGKTKEHQISRMIESSEPDVLLNEITLCRLKCRNCHLRSKQKRLGYRKLEDFSEKVLSKARMYLELTLRKDSEGSYGAKLLE